MRLQHNALQRQTLSTAAAMDCLAQGSSMGM